MKKFRVTITETEETTILVEAPNETEAERLALDNWLANGTEAEGLEDCCQFTDREVSAEEV